MFSEPKGNLLSLMKVVWFI